MKIFKTIILFDAISNGDESSPDRMSRDCDARDDAIKYYSWHHKNTELINQQKNNF
jgi:hypothetical protein